MARHATVWLLAGMLLTAAACTPKSEQAAAPAPEPPAAPAAPAPANPHGADPHALGGTPLPAGHVDEMAMAHGAVDVSAAAKKGKTVVPPEVAGRWKAATFILVDRGGSQATEIQVPLEGEYTFGDGHLKLFLHHFLPDLKINDDNVYTSVSNNPDNPAAHVTIYEDGKEVFEGWLFSEFPGIHPFQHPRYGVTLKAGVPS
ncbi:MAG: DUF2155 domain-containing protein [Nitrospirae bacterium]|nr:DUF2155 domain-containing protein [Nitrospirota bacterium]